MSGPDLHLHSTASDGTCTPARLVALARAAGLPAIALTDHDSVGGIDAAIDAAAGTTLAIIPGVELSAGIGDRGIHILGYFIDHHDTTLLDRLEHLRRVRLERAERIVWALARDGYTISLDDVLGLAADGAVGRAHIAQLLVAAGYVATVSEAFKTLLGSSAPYYVPKPVSTPEEVVRWIGEAGGVAVVAHPGLSKIADLIPRLVDAGIAGIEAYHGSHDATTTEYYASLAREHGLIATGGSDFHAEDRDGASPGSANVPDHVLADLVSARERLARAGR